MCQAFVLKYVPQPKPASRSRCVLNVLTRSREMKEIGAKANISIISPMVTVGSTTVLSCTLYLVYRISAKPLPKNRTPSPSIQSISKPTLGPTPQERTLPYTSVTEGVEAISPSIKNVAAGELFK